MPPKIKEMRLDLDYTGINLADEEKNMSNIDLTSAVITNAIYNYAKQAGGLHQNERKQVYTIEKAIKNNENGVVKIDSTDVGFLRKIFREVKLTPNSILEKVDTMIEEISKE